MESRLPSGLEKLITSHSGHIRHVSPAGGHMSDHTVFIESDRGTFFIKAMQNRPGGRRDSLMREAAINKALAGIAPKLRFQTGDTDWVALGFDYVRSRHPDIGPGSQDLGRVMLLIDRIGGLVPPASTHDWVETRWDGYADRPELLRGNALLHTDLHPSNILIGADQTCVVDWAWPTRGAGFIDPALFVIQLIAAGHSPQQAESWVSKCAAWRNASPAALHEFALASMRMQARMVERSPDTAWLQAMLDACRRWFEYRHSKK
ncbi:hypothetical protein [Actinomadura hibisca]|uniref:hypothetical protein n=1 Tax=Actinomadura hibisca TaxID=68565 RepID=UPI0008319F49|nr:hypothetical protein [Actinomadura hibisca]